MPTKAMSSAPIEGPTTRATLISVRLRATAFCIWSTPTSSEAKLWRAGLSATSTAPRPAAKSITIQSSTTCARTTAASASANAPAADWVTHMILRLSEAIGENAAPRSEEQHRQILRGDHDPEVGAGMRWSSSTSHAWPRV